MNAYQLIRKKRDGGELAPAEVKYLVQNFVEGEVADYQMAAFLMAVFFRGLSQNELNVLIKVMMRSGTVVDLAFIDGIKVDKHSTGGVGDKISLILAPLVAAAGVHVPMMSGRGLGHTGGTLDKLESIAGFRTNLSLTEYKQFIEKNKLAFIGQTENIAPADKKMYALRDVTATVESIPLITASILSKKLAEGADAFVFDVKTGNGAFMAQEDKAIELAKLMTQSVRTFNKTAVAYITDMNQPLGRYVGNALEVKESIETLCGNGPKDLVDLTITLGAEMLLLAGVVNSFELGCDRIENLIQDRSGYVKFLETVELQNGNRAIAENPDLLPVAPVQLDVTHPQAGYIQKIDTFAMGMLSVQLGVGRTTVDSPINPAVGFVLHKKIGDAVTVDEPFLTIHSATKEQAEQLVPKLQSIYTVGPKKIPAPPLIKYRITADEVTPWSGR